ncbi:PAS domain-containing sensor histidine kinase [Deinococcus daejeonensis]|uniref:histidine kinase n=1 Tax=Deinococcus daejeonensis TaxID=1007098 RepID=A0ABQ2J473_9DEIO|nr:PAS domain-containing sensor histidine kinase [Deinococcus daejeonensis]GGN37876.1 hypothetical protein GCM10010842_20180 [Deinococcus daejeonensis]
MTDNRAPGAPRERRHWSVSLLLDRINQARRERLLGAVEQAQALTVADLRGPGAVDLLGRERSGIARDLHLAEVTLAALAALLALTITTVIPAGRARRDLHLETERRTESERARAALERTAQDLRAAEGALQRERDFAMQVMEPMGEGLALTGTRREELLGLSEAQFERVLPSRCEVARPASRPPPGVDVLQVVRPARRVLKCTRRPMDAGDGVVLGHVMYFRDITHEAEISNMKSDFMSTAAHVLRTPMTSIYGFTELLLTRELDPKTTRDLLETIYRQAGQLILLLTELLDLARIEARAGQDFRIAHEAVRPLIENTVRAFTPPHERSRVCVQVAPNLPLLPVDATKFNQALGNVLSNAFKYSPQGGEVLVHAWMDPLHPLLHVSVTDQGIGMTAEQRHQAFERFYRADSSGSIPGTGLGLSLVQEIMHCHAEQRAGAGQCRHADLPHQSRPSGEPCPRKY